MYGFKMKMKEEELGLPVAATKSAVTPCYSLQVLAVFKTPKVFKTFGVLNTPPGFPPAQRALLSLAEKKHISSRISFEHSLFETLANRLHTLLCNPVFLPGMTRFLLRRIFFLGVALALAGITHAQTEGGGSGGGGNGTEQKAPSSKAKRKKDKAEWKKNRKKQMNDEKMRKEYNKKYNTKKTRRHMKQAQKKAQKNNEHKRDFFLVRWWKHLTHR